jgi:hypothetical protein
MTKAVYVYGGTPEGGVVQDKIDLANQGEDKPIRATLHLASTNNLVVYTLPLFIGHLAE